MDAKRRPDLVIDTFLAMDHYERDRAFHTDSVQLAGTPPRHLAFQTQAARHRADDYTRASHQRARARLPNGIQRTMNSIGTFARQQQVSRDHPRLVQGRFPQGSETVPRRKRHPPERATLVQGPQCGLHPRPRPKRDRAGHVHRKRSGNQDHRRSERLPNAPVTEAFTPDLGTRSMLCAISILHPPLARLSQPPSRPPSGVAPDRPTANHTASCCALQCSPRHGRWRLRQTRK